MRRLLIAITTLSVLAVVGCSAEHDTATDAPPSSSVTSAATSSTPRSAMPNSYRYVLGSSCGERGLLGRYRVVVRDGVVASVQNLNDDYPYQPDLAEMPTLAGLVEKAESAKPPAVVNLDLDGSGLPRSLEIDHVPNGIDDEECYEVSALRVLD
jgi:hypothetical protein